MSFLAPLLAHAAPAAAASAAAAPVAGAAATGLGHLLNVDPMKISGIADSVGKGMNMVAGAGGATGGYQTQPGSTGTYPELPDVQNHMQLLDPNILQAIMQHFRKAQY